MVDQPARRAHLGGDVADRRGRQALATATSRAAATIASRRWSGGIRVGACPQRRTHIAQASNSGYRARTDRGDRDHRRRGPARHDPDDPVPRAHGALNETQLWSHWSGYLAADRYQMSRQVRVLRGPQRGRASSTRARSTSTGSPAGTPRRSWPGSSPATSGRARPGTPSTRAGWTTAASSSRTASSSTRGKDEYLLTSRRAQLRLLRRPDRPPGRHDRGGQRRDRARSPSRARARATCSSGSSRRWSTSPTSGSRTARSAARR